MYTIHAYDFDGDSRTHHRDSRDEAESLADALIGSPYVESVAVLPPHPTPEQQRLQALREQFGGAL